MCHILLTSHDVNMKFGNCAAESHASHLPAIYIIIWSSIKRSPSSMSKVILVTGDENSCQSSAVVHALFAQVPTPVSATNSLAFWHKKAIKYTSELETKLQARKPRE